MNEAARLSDSVLLEQFIGGDMSAYEGLVRGMRSRNGAERKATSGSKGMISAMMLGHAPSS